MLDRLLPGLGHLSLDEVVEKLRYGLASLRYDDLVPGLVVGRIIEHDHAHSVVTRSLLQRREALLVGGSKYVPVLDEDVRMCGSATMRQCFEYRYGVELGHRLHLERHYLELLMRNVLERLCSDGHQIGTRPRPARLPSTLESRFLDDEGVEPSILRPFVLERLSNRSVES